MEQPAAIVTGASRGIGLALARALAAHGYALTLNSRRAEPLELVADKLRESGHQVETAPGSIADEAVICDVVQRHRRRFSRLDVLVNNAGVGVAEDIKHLTTKRLDLQIGVNLRAVPLFYREALEMLTTTAAAHGQAHVINVASISGKYGEAGLSAYSATKSAVVGFTQAMNEELGSAGVKSCAICPAWVDTPMSDFVKTQIAPDRMITVQDVCELVVALLRLSPGCTVPEIILEQTAPYASEWRSTETPAHLPGEGHGG